MSQPKVSVGDVEVFGILALSALVVYGVYKLVNWSPFGEEKTLTENPKTPDNSSVGAGKPPNLYDGHLVDDAVKAEQSANQGAGAGPAEQDRVLSATLAASNASTQIEDTSETIQQWNA